MTTFYLLANCDHTQVHLGRHIQKKCNENTKVDGVLYFPTPPISVALKKHRNHRENGPCCKGK